MKRVVLVLIVAAVIAGLELSRTGSGDLRRFDPNEVARLEMEMWHDYYDRRKAALFFRLASMLRSQYGQPFLRSQVTAFRAARAAFVFQEGTARPGYEKALPDLRDYYAAILAPGANVPEAARLELEWWIVHRERATAPAGSLERALAELQAEIYQMPATAFAEHARLRAEAMLLRDRKAEAGGVTDADWVRIRELLDGSWMSLSWAVR